MKDELTIQCGGRFSGTVNVPSSKSYMHRLIICTALAGGGKIYDKGICDDTLCTLNLLPALGFGYSMTEDSIEIYPISELSREAEISESGSSLRFILPLLCTADKDETILTLGDKLADRPLSPLIDALKQSGAQIRYISSNVLSVGGRCVLPHEMTVDASQSSQFVSGLLFALASDLLEHILKTIGNKVSRGYIEMTLHTLRAFGAKIGETEDGYLLHGTNGLAAPQKIICEGDYSTAAYFMAGAALTGGDVLFSGLANSSLQGDSAITDALEIMGAHHEWFDNGCLRISSCGRLKALDIDCTDTPDLIPILAAAASAAEGTSLIRGISRLHGKESDRVLSTEEMILSLGGNIHIDGDSFVIEGREKLDGGYVNCYNDHRIAMSAAIAASVCRSDVKIDNRHCVGKSCPEFWSMFDKCRSF